MRGSAVPCPCRAWHPHYPLLVVRLIDSSPGSPVRRSRQSTKGNPLEWPSGAHARDGHVHGRVYTISSRSTKMRPGRGRGQAEAEARRGRGLGMASASGLGPPVLGPPASVLGPPVLGPRTWSSDLGLGPRTWSSDLVLGLVLGLGLGLWPRPRPIYSYLLVIWNRGSCETVRGTRTEDRRSGGPRSETEDRGQ